MIGAGHAYADILNYTLAQTEAFLAAIDRQESRQLANLLSVTATGSQGSSEAVTAAALLNRITMPPTAARRDPVRCSPPRSGQCWQRLQPWTSPPDEAATGAPWFQSVEKMTLDYDKPHIALVCPACGGPAAVANVALHQAWELARYFRATVSGLPLLVTANLSRLTA